MSYIVLIKQRGTVVGFSRGSSSEAVALALRLIHNGETHVSITSPRGVVYESADFNMLASDLNDVANEIPPLRYEPVGKSRANRHEHRH